MMKDIPVPPDNVLPSRLEMGGLDNKENTHCGNTRRRLFWPSISLSHADMYHAASEFSGKVWIELGFSAASLMPFSRGYHHYMAFDERSWTKKMMDRSHSPKVSETFIVSDMRFPDTPNVHVLRGLAERCNDLDTDEKIGVAFFLMSRLRGVSRICETLERSIDCSAQNQGRADVLSKHYILAPVFLMDSAFAAKSCLKTIGQELMGEADKYHININRPLGDDTARIVKSMTECGFSWSCLIHEENKSIARSVSSSAGGKVAKIDKFYYASREN